MNFDIDTLFANPKALVTIYFPSTGGGTPTTNPDGSPLPSVIYGLVENDFNTDVASLYSSVDPGVTAAAQTGANMAQSLIGGANRVIKNIQQTLQRWDGHSSPTFTVPITVVKYKDNIDILQIVRTLVAAPAGTYESAITMKAPYGYGFNGLLGNVSPSQALATAATFAADTASGIANGTILTDPTSVYSNINFSSNYQNISSQIYGTFTLKYSDWFIASDLIITHVSATIAKEAVKGTNEPLYARLNVSFTTAYLPDARQIAAWFLDRQPDDGRIQNTPVTTPINGNGGIGSA